MLGSSRTDTIAEAKSMSLSLMRKVQHSSTRNPEPNIKRAIRALTLHSRGAGYARWYTHRNIRAARSLTHS